MTTKTEAPDREVQVSITDLPNGDKKVIIRREICGPDGIPIKRLEIGTTVTGRSALLPRQELIEHIILAVKFGIETGRVEKEDET